MSILNKVVGMAVIAASMTACSTQRQVEGQQVGDSQVEPAPIVKKVYIKVPDKSACHSHTFKGYGWSKRVSHCHPAPHKHTKKVMRRTVSKNRHCHKSNGLVKASCHVHVSKSPRHNHRYSKMPACRTVCRATYK